MMRDAGVLHLMRTASGFTHHNAVRKRLLGAAVQSVTFLDDHRVMRDFGVDHGPDWRLDGQRFHEHLGIAHWTPARSYPASVTKDLRLRILVELAPDPIDADPIDVELVGRPLALDVPEGTEAPFLTFEARFRLGEEALASIPIVLHATTLAPNEVFLCEHFVLKWTLRVAGIELDLGSTGPHDVYVTYGVPDDGLRPERGPPGTYPPPWLDQGSVPLEGGLTRLRLRESVSIVEQLLLRTYMALNGKPRPQYLDPETGLPMDRDDPHTIVRAVLAICENYTLRGDLLLAEYAHASYFNRDRTPVGSWPILHWRNEAAECQAIVRLVRAVALAIGLPGTIELVAVYARPDVDGGKTPIVDLLLPLDSDPAKYPLGHFRAGLSRGPRHPDPRRSHQRAALTDRVVAVGQEVGPYEVFNNYEACLRFRHGGRIFYYGGGIPDVAHRTPEDVLKQFQQLVWVHYDYKQDGRHLVVEIIRDLQKK
jgi:hypothetical protein